MATSFIFVAKVRTPFKKTFPANLFLYLFVLYIEVYREVFSCPLTGFLHFYNPYILERGTVLNVSMPFNGLSLFLRDINGAWGMGLGVSMPFNGLSLFLPDSGLVMDVTNSVSMPFNGLSLFLLIDNLTPETIKDVYQCPLTGLLHFYEKMELEELEDFISINAL